MIGRPQGSERIAQVLLGVTALIAFANGLFMLYDPFGWYNIVPTVKFTGPPNLHFLRDIGLAYVVSGVMLAYASLRPADRWLAAVVGNLWMTVHGMLHIWEVSVGICGPDVFRQGASGVFLPPVLAWLALALLYAKRNENPVIAE